MNEILQPAQQETPAHKLYSLNTIFGGAFVGGPLMAGYIIASNFKAQGDRSRARLTWIISIAFTLALFSFLLFVPSLADKIPKHFIPILYCGAAYGIMYALQKQQIEAHEAAGGKMYSGWRAFGISLIALVITTVPVVGFTLLTDSAAEVETQYFGESRHEIYYTSDNITEAEVLGVGNVLQTTWLFDNSESRGVYLVKEGTTYEIYVPLVDGAWDDPAAVEDFTGLRRFLQEKFDNPVVINLCAEFDDVKKRIE